MGAFSFSCEVCGFLFFCLIGCLQDLDYCVGFVVLWCVVCVFWGGIFILKYL